MKTDTKIGLYIWLKVVLLFGSMGLLWHCTGPRSSPRAEAMLTIAEEAATALGGQLNRERCSHFVRKQPLLNCQTNWQANRASVHAKLLVAQWAFQTTANERSLTMDTFARNDYRLVIVWENGVSVVGITVLDRP